jgi:hypothetical protein
MQQGEQQSCQITPARLQPYDGGLTAPHSQWAAAPGHWALNSP